MKALRSDLGVISCYFNANRFKSKRDNYTRFITGIERLNLPYRIVECAFANAPFELADTPQILRVRSRDILWQKERLLNLALAALPPSCTKVAWLDCDLIFDDPSWADRASQALETFPVIQPFSSVVRLPGGQTQYLGVGETYFGFGSIHAAWPELSRSGEFAQHGHTGFAWAARRDLLAKHGFYDCCLTGSGDHLMAHALCGHWNSKCMDGMLQQCRGGYRQHFDTWASHLFEDVLGSVGYITGRLLHLWHGSTTERRYYLRNREFSAFEFNPNTDIKLNADRVWEWASQNPDLHEWARTFFEARQEDQEGPSVFTPSRGGTDR
jgi:hypothetical protein